MGTDIQKHQEKELQLKEHSTGLIAILTDVDKSREFERGLSIQKIIDNSVPVREIVRATGSIKPVAQALDIALTKLVGSINVNQNLNDSQIKVIVEDLLDKYPNESLEDFILCFKKARQGEFGTIYHLHSAVIFGWMEVYLGDKYDALIRKMDREKENMYARPDKMPETGEGYELFKQLVKELNENKTKNVRPLFESAALEEGKTEPKKKKGISWPVSTPEKEAEINAKIELGRKIHELSKVHPSKTIEELKSMVEK